MCSWNGGEQRLAEPRHVLVFGLTDALLGATPPMGTIPRRWLLSA